MTTTQPETPTAAPPGEPHQRIANVGDGTEEMRVDWRDPDGAIVHTCYPAWRFVGDTYWTLYQSACHPEQAQPQRKATTQPASA